MVKHRLPKFQTDYAETLYEYEEIRDYIKNPPKRQTAKSQAIENLQHLSRKQVSQMIEERLNYVMSRVKVLETHFVSGTSEASERTQATPRKNEFNMIAVDIFLRYPEHKFLFANPKHLEPSNDDANHLQQNYIMGFVFPGEDGELELTEEWYQDFNEVYETLNPTDCIQEEDMQVDNRYVITEGTE